MKKSAATEGESPSRLIDARIEELGDWRGKTLAHVRALIKQADPEVVEEWKWRGVPVWSHDGIICTGETYKSVVKLTFAKGASLDDPAGLFNSSLEGNTRRAIDIHEGDEHRRGGVQDADPRRRRPEQVKGPIVESGAAWVGADPSRRDVRRCLPRSLAWAGGRLSPSRCFRRRRRTDRRHRTRAPTRRRRAASRASPAPLPFADRSRRRSLSSPSQVPCQSSPSTQVTPVTKRLDSMVRRIAPVSGST